MTPAIATALGLPRVVSPNDLAALKTEEGAHHFRLVGLNITVATQPLTWALVTLGDGEQKNLKHHSVCEKCAGFYAPAQASKCAKKGARICARTGQAPPSAVRDGACTL